ncbi:LAQU0S15e02212g1_1 [Lachancea quebecensis]|uniref:LAQU0S15e02212g1_1 n=1 Tax=Lachancea quebecensis TaxID=1654605 RepID=A0A0P1KVY1_9SACH|nr:LAQU0S15e02212g1_1 [Lachancea quebecensis]
MGLFSKRNVDVRKEYNKNDIIKCNKALRPRSLRTGKHKRTSELSKEESLIFDHVLKHFQEEGCMFPVQSPRVFDSEHCEELPEQPLSSWEKSWLTAECILRFLRSTKWDQEESIARLTSTIIWRREFGIFDDEGRFQSTLAEAASAENRSGKILLLGYDRSQRPILIIRPGRQNTTTSFAQIQHLIFMVESAMALMPPGVESITVLIDFQTPAGTPFTRMPPLSVSRQVLHLLQKHYPECLGRAILINIPWYGWNFLKLFHPLIDPATRPKIRYEDTFDDHVDETQLETSYGGRLNFTFDHEVYWPDLMLLLSERNKGIHKRFLESGGQVGQSEFELKDISDVLESPACDEELEFLSKSHD